MKRRIVLGLMALLFVSISTFAQRGPRGDRNFDNRNGRGLIEKLDLTEDQQSKIEKLRVGHFKATQDLRDQLNEKEVKLKSLMNDDDVDNKGIEKLVNEISDIKKSLMLARVNHQIEVRALLNDEQKAKFDMMAHNRGGRRQMRRF